MGQVLQAGAGQITARQAAVNGGHPDDRAGHHRQQGVPLGHQRHLPGRPDDPVRRGRHRRRRRHGVDDASPLPAPRRPGGLPHRRPEGRRLDDVRRPLLRLRPGAPWAPAPRSTPRRPASPASRRTSWPPSRTSGPPGPHKDGLFDDEIVKVEIPQRKGDPIVFDTDEGVRGETTVESLGRAAPRLRQGRQHHRRQRLADLRRRRRGDRGLEGRGRASSARSRSARSSATARWPVPTPSLLTQPARAIKAGRSSGPASRSATSTCSSSTRPSPPSAWPRWPTSASPTRSSTSTAAPSPSATRSACPAPASALTLLNELARRGGGLGAAALCGGGGQGDAILLQTV